MWTVWCKAIAMNVLNMTLVIIGSGSTSIILFMIMNIILYQKGDITAIHLVVHR